MPHISTDGSKVLDLASGFMKADMYNTCTAPKQCPYIFGGSAASCFYICICICTYIYIYINRNEGFAGTVYLGPGCDGLGVWPDGRIVGAPLSSASVPQMIPEEPKIKENANLSDWTCHTIPRP